MFSTDDEATFRRSRLLIANQAEIDEFVAVARMVRARRVSARRADARTDVGD